MLLEEEFDELALGEDEAEDGTEEVSEEPTAESEETVVGDINPALNINVEDESSQSQPEVTIEESPEVEPETEPEADPEADLDQEDNGDNKDEPNFA